MLEARTHHIVAPHAKSQSTANSHLCIEPHAERRETATKELVHVENIENLTTVRMDSPHDTTRATDLNEIRERLNKFEFSVLAEFQDQTANDANNQSYLKHLTSRVDAVQKCSDSAELTSIDVDLKRQHVDHVTDCEAKHQDQDEILKARMESMKRQLQHRIDHNFDLQSHMATGHRRADRPSLLETQSPTRTLKSPGEQGSISSASEITKLEQRFASIAAQVDKLIIAKELWDVRDVPSQLNTWASNIRSDVIERKKDVAEDVTTLLARVEALEAKCENLQVQLKIVRRNMQNGSA